MMLRRFAIVFALCALAFLNRGARAEDKPDTSTPKGAAAAFFKAMEAGDVAASKSLATGSEKQLAVLETLVPVVHSFKQLENAAVKTWGEEGRKTLPQESAGSFNFEEQLKAATEEISGENATITPTGASTGAKAENKKDPMKLKKVDGAWKLDMTSIPAEEVSNAETARLLKTMANVAKTTADEINQGKYKSAAEAKQAMEQKILGALGGAGPIEKNTEGKKEEPKK